MSGSSKKACLLSTFFYACSFKNRGAKLVVITGVLFVRFSIRHCPKLVCHLTVTVQLKAISMKRLTLVIKTTKISLFNSCRVVCFAGVKN
jgi:hypothetical protein